MSRAVPLVVTALLIMAGCNTRTSAQPPPSTSDSTSSAPRPPSTTGPRSPTVPRTSIVATTTTANEPPATTAAPVSTTPETTAPPASTTPYSVVAHQPAGLDQLPNREVVAPIRVRVEGLDIDALVVPVSAEPDDGELAVPPSPELVAWYQHGPAPGDGGSTVLAAHVAWDGERGAFFTLDEVTAGASVVVTVADGRDVVYRVTRIEQMAKSDLPRAEMFARDGPARLALVTCGGNFNRDRRHYDDNVVVFAELV